MDDAVPAETALNCAACEISSSTPMRRMFTSFRPSIRSVFEDEPRVDSSYALQSDRSNPISLRKAPPESSERVGMCHVLNRR